MTRVCFFKGLPGAGPCDGALVRCHLISRQELKRACGRDILKARRMIDSPRSWVWGCGGPMGLSGHHGAFDVQGIDPLRVPRHRIPPETEEFAEKLGLGWYMDRTYGPREEAA